MPANPVPLNEQIARAVNRGVPVFRPAVVETA